MNEMVQIYQVAFQTNPRHVWKTLTEQQRQTVLRTFVQICHSFIDQGKKEGKDEPDPER